MYLMNGVEKQLREQFAVQRDTFSSSHLLTVRKFAVLDNEQDQVARTLITEELIRRGDLPVWELN